MIKFNGTSEEQWMKTQAHRIKNILKKLKEYEKTHPNRKCPLER
jgi:hypothetical protein